MRPVLPPPSVINGEVRGFCSGISSATPLYVPVRPARKAVQSYCFDNVAKWIKKHGGSIAYGWAIWFWPGAYFEAEHHGVWRNKKGALIDVTPPLRAINRILFLPDDTAVYDPLSFRSNILKPVCGNPVAVELVEVGKACLSVLDSYRVPGVAVRLTWIDNARCLQLQARFDELSRQLLEKCPLDPQGQLTPESTPG